MASYISHLPNSFYGQPKAPRRGGTFRPYLAPRSSAFGGTLGTRPAATTPPAPSGGSGGSVSPSTATTAPAGFTPTVNGLPPDPGYQQTVAGIDRTTGDTIGGLLAGRTDYLSSAGYTATYDPSGNVTGVAIDPNNPYSQASLLRKNFQQAKTGNVNSSAAQGQLYAGSLQNSQDAATNQFNIADNGLTNGVIRFLHQNAASINSARDTGETNKGIAFGQSVANAPNNPAYNPAAAGGTYSGDANGNTALTASNGDLALTAGGQGISVVKLASGYSLVRGPDGTALYFLDPSGKRVGS